MCTRLHSHFADFAGGHRTAIHSTVHRKQKGLLLIKKVSKNPRNRFVGQFLPWKVVYRLLNGTYLRPRPRRCRPPPPISRPLLVVKQGYT